MTDQPDFRFEVTYAEIVAALDRGDYGWLVENVRVSGSSPVFPANGSLLMAPPFPRSGHPRAGAVHAREAHRRPGEGRHAPQITPTGRYAPINERSPPDDYRAGGPGAPKLDHTDRGGVPAFLDRRKANVGADDSAEPSYVDLVTGGGR